MMREISVKLIGTDYWGRDVYQNIESKRLYKNLENPKLKSLALYTTSEFEGEPDMPLREDIIITVVEQE